MNKYYTLRSRAGRISFQIEKRTVYVVWMLILMFAVLFMLGLSIGSSWINPLAVLRQLLGIGDGEHAFTISTLRLPRMLVASLAGAALGVSGLILQSMVRNPLASPDIIGITGGAAAAAVFFITTLAEELGTGLLPVAAIVGAGTVSLLIYVLAWKQGVSPIRLVLIGIGLSAATSALTTMMIVLSPTYATTKAYIWMTGSVYGASWSAVDAMLPWILSFLVISAFFTRAINAQELGDQVAAGIGARVQAHRFGLLLVSVALAGSAVAFAGGIGFVGLIAPHVARKLVGRSFGSLLPVTMLVGAMIVFVADVIARTAFLPLDIPAGVFVSGIGAPFFIYLLYRNRHQL